ncbi:MAG: DHH family phosphoesterase [Candidatus Dojkabacteria bacterium]|nr:DHH family phosphoesterase [Candidatus Dojkabacteria bacterium]
MNNKHKQLKKKIEKAKKILIVSHRGPDMDAFSSMLLTKEFLNIYFPSKEVVIKAKQLPSFNIPRMHDITVVETLDEGDEDLIIVVDAGEIRLVCDERDSLDKTSKDIVIIDHHQTVIDNGYLIINDNRSSAAEQVIYTFKEILGKRFKLTDEIAQLGQYGINADTGRFLYETTTPDTLRLYADLYEFSPIDLEEVTYKVNKFPKESTEVIAKLLERIEIDGDMMYTYVDLDDIERWKDPYIGSAIMFFKNNILRYIQGIHWGFVVEPSTKEKNVWYVTFRGTKGYQRVDRIAEELGGGGHMYASGAKIVYNEPKTLDYVIKDVREAIKKHI